jgi:hypothetical protein
MGKKSRNKPRARVLAAQKKTIKPDDYFQRGPIEMARFGKLVISRSNMSKEEFDQMQHTLVERYPKVCQDIDDTVSKIAELVRKLPPDELLKRAYWEMAIRHLNKPSEAELTFDDSVSVRMIDYIQSVIVSVIPENAVEPQITDEQWHELRKLVDKLFSGLNLDYQICLTAFNRQRPGFTKAFEEYYFKAQAYWCNVRGRRYLVHEIPFFRDVLSPHDLVVNELYGISIEDLLGALKNLQDSLTLGIGKVMEDLLKFRDLTLNQLQKRIEAGDVSESDDFSGLLNKVIDDNKWANWREDIFGRFAGLDLFDVEKVAALPRTLLDDLSWEPGQNTEFFKEGDYKGWPLRIWPIFQRPFIKLKERYYCFELHNLFDNLYRIIQRAVLKIKPDYRETWNEKQQELSERLPVELFRAILPGAKVFNHIYYQCSTTPGGAKNWCEADALVIYQDHLFIVEIKAGAFTYTSPATDFPAYIESLKNLVLQPAEQGKRFLEYVQSDERVTLFDSGHREICELSRRDFEHVTICAITLDAFTELAAQVQHLKTIGIDVGAQPIWSMSIDDLRVYADVFDNPLVFLHFVEERMRAFNSALIQTEDELDHLGLYLKHNIYTEHAKNLNPEGKLIWHGYRSDVDRYFSKKLHDPNTVYRLRQDMPRRLKEIVDFLAKTALPKRSRVSSLLLNCAGDTRSNVTSAIDEILKEQTESQRSKPLSTYGEIKITLFCWQQGLLERKKALAFDQARAAMLVAQDKERLLLELSFDTSERLIDVNYTFLRFDDIPTSELNKLKALAEELRLTRIQKGKQHGGKIGRNNYCPCGSGKKYKRCCLLLGAI